MVIKKGSLKDKKKVKEGTNLGSNMVNIFGKKLSKLVMVNNGQNCPRVGQNYNFTVFTVFLAESKQHG